jgi:hypothetical protein
LIASPEDTVVPPVELERVVALAIDAIRLVALSATNSG